MQAAAFQRVKSSGADLYDTVKLDQTKAWDVFFFSKGMLISDFGSFDIFKDPQPHPQAANQKLNESRKKHHFRRRPQSLLILCRFYLVDPADCATVLVRITFFSV